MAWWLVDSIINGTLDEDYPIMSKNEDDVVILGGEDTISLEPGEAATDDTISADFPEDNVYAATTVPFDTSWWNDDGFSITGNPGGAGIDTIYLGGSGSDTLNLGAFHVPGGMGNDHINLDVGAGNTAWDGNPSWNSGLASTDVHYHDSKYYATNVYSKPQPDLKDGSTQKYQEDKGIADLKDYVASTYQGHYTNDNSDVQTLDLIHSVGDAESFCRSNAIKYLSRYDKKGQAKRDILKAMHYCLLLYYFSGNTNNETPTRGYETF